MIKSLRLVSLLLAATFVCALLSIAALAQNSETQRLDAYDKQRRLTGNMVGALREAGHTTLAASQTRRRSVSEILNSLKFGKAPLSESAAQALSDQSWRVTDYNGGVHNYADPRKA